MTFFPRGVSSSFPHAPGTVPRDLVRRNGSGPARRRGAEGGAALLVVLGLVAVMAVVVVAFTARSSRDLSSSQSVSSQVVAEDVASTVTEILIEDFKGEIQAGSLRRRNAAKEPLPGLYPATPYSAAPDRSTLPGALGGEGAPPNLIKQSSRESEFFNRAKRFGAEPVYPAADQFPPRGPASAVSTASGPAGISAERWNKPLLLPRAQPDSPTDRAPATTGFISLLQGQQGLSWTWTPPDWFYLRRDGSLQPKTDNLNGNPVVARFAYQVYDIGGLLDLNVAGYDPQLTGDGLAALRGSVGLANLRELGFTPQSLQSLVQFRNPATILEQDGLPYRNRYLNFLFSSTLNQGFLRTASSSTVQGGAQAAALTNRGFPSRGALLAFVEQLATDNAAKVAMLNALSSLTHYSRSLEQPSFQPGFRNPKSPAGVWETVRPTIVPPAGRVDDRLYDHSVIRKGNDPRNWGGLWRGDWRSVLEMPYEMALGNNRGGNDAWGTLAERAGVQGDVRALQDVINPAFLDLRVRDRFVRMDGTQALPGEPLVKKRFPLERLAWITSAGPSASQAAGSPLYNAAGTVQAIYDAFGLTWMTDPKSRVSFWAYDHGRTGGIYRLEDLLAVDPARGLPREPDFFELLKASIGVGSLGKSALPSHEAPDPLDPAVHQQVRDRSSNLQIFEIAANLIDQADRDSFPTLLRVPNPSPDRAHSSGPYDPPLYAVYGVEDLPYFYRLHFRGIRNAKNAPSPEVEMPVEITDSLKEFANRQRGFRPGITSIMAFPELWNPHAKSAAPYNGPVNFRVVASSETPRFLGDPLLQAAPKQGRLQGNVADTPMFRAMRAGNRSFISQPGGFFAYRSESELYPDETNLWMRTVSGNSKPRPSSVPFNIRTPSQLWNVTTMGFEWPIRLGLSGLDIIDLGNQNPKFLDRRPSTLFWDRPSPVYAPIREGEPMKALLESMIPDIRTTTNWAMRTRAGRLEDGYLENVLFLNFLWRLPELDDEGNYPWMKPPRGWPLTLDPASPMPFLRTGGPLGNYRGAPFLITNPKRLDMGLTDQGYIARRVKTPTVSSFTLMHRPTPTPALDVDLFRSFQQPGSFLAPPYMRPRERAATAAYPTGRTVMAPDRLYAMWHLDGRNPWPAERWFYGVRPFRPRQPLELEIWRALRPRDRGLASNLTEEEFDLGDPTWPGYVPGLPGLPRFGPLRYPLAFDPHNTYSTASFHAGYGTLKYELDGKRVEDPFPMYRMWVFSLSAQDNLQRSILQTDPLSKTPSGELDWSEKRAGSAPDELGNWHDNWVVDMRGSELRFSTGNADLFRDPSTLCLQGFPAGSGFSAGPSNFFSGDLYRGGVVDREGKMWVGFSLGEVPSQVVVASKIGQVPRKPGSMQFGDAILMKWESEGTYHGRSWRWPEAGDAYYSMPVLDLPSNKLGLTQDRIPRREAEHMARFFIVPNNLVHMSGMYLTVRVEYQNPTTGAWTPYDERYLKVGFPADDRYYNSGAAEQILAVPVDGRGELELKLSDPSNRLKRGELYVQNAQGQVRFEPTRTPIGWGTPMLTSYDPRTSRFGSPFRTARTLRTAVHGANAMERQNFTPPPDAVDMGPTLGLIPSGGFTDRPSPVTLDSSAGGSKPVTTVPNRMVPGQFNMMLTANNRWESMAAIFRDVTVGRGTSWWANAAWNRRMIYQYPTANSFDIGWFPRFHGQGVQEPLGVTPNYRGVVRGGTVPNFVQSFSPAGRFADTLRIGSFSENIAPTEATPEDTQAPYRQAYADPDDVVRRADGAFAGVSGYSPRMEGLPMSQPGGGAEARDANRPTILNRPFQSVAEMGYAFRGTPWKTLGFSTPESADAALLDVFCVSEPPPVQDPVEKARRNASPQARSQPSAESAPPLVAGKVNLNTRQEPVLRALLSGALKDAQGRAVGVTPEEASRAAQALIGRTTGREIWNGPLTNVSELIGKLFAKDLADGQIPPNSPVYTSRVPRTFSEPNRNPDMSVGRNWLTWHYTGYSADLDARVFQDSRDWKVQRRRAAILRALADAGQTRVWNLFFDIVVQTGQLPVGVNALARFAKSSECRAWVCVSIDRLTGEVLDHQVEWVSE